MTWLVSAAMAQESAPAPAAAPPAAEGAAVPAAPPAHAATGAAPAETATHSEVGQPAGEHKGPFPPFDTHTFPSQLFWFVICFGVLYILMKRVISPRIGAIVEGRAERIANDIAEAQRLRTSSDAALAAYEKSLTEARGSAHKIAQTATDEAKAAADKRRAEIEAEVAARLAEAETRIGDIKTKALADVGAIAEEAASAVVEALIGQQPASDEVKAAVAAVATK
jgi:F-type H+-transporting ATPase subunit b